MSLEVSTLVGWGLSSCGIWYHITRLYNPDVSKDHIMFILKGLGVWEEFAFDLVECKGSKTNSAIFRHLKFRPLKVVAPHSFHASGIDFLVLWYYIIQRSLTSPKLQSFSFRQNHFPKRVLVPHWTWG